MILDHDTGDEDRRDIEPVCAMCGRDLAGVVGGVLVANVCTCGWRARMFALVVAVSLAACARDRQCPREMPAEVEERPRGLEIGLVLCDAGERAAIAVDGLRVVRAMTLDSMRVIDEYAGMVEGQTS